LSKRGENEREREMEMETVRERRGAFQISFEPLFVFSLTKERKRDPS